MGIMPVYPDNAAIRELRDELKDLNASTKKAAKATERYTLILLFVALVQMVIMMVQLGVSFDSDGPFPKWVTHSLWGLLLIVAIIIVWTQLIRPVFDARNLWAEEGQLPEESPPVIGGNA